MNYYEIPQVLSENGFSKALTDNYSIVNKSMTYRK